MEEEQEICFNASYSELLSQFEAFLRQEEHSVNTVEKYVRDLRAFFRFCGKGPVTRGRLLAWKERLMGCYASSSVNSMLAAVNRFLSWTGYAQCRLKLIKVQREIFSEPERELSLEEYKRLVRRAREEGKERLCLLLQTICATGIRVSELPYVTAQAVRLGRVEVDCKGKRRTVFLPEQLKGVLLNYLKKQKRTVGPVFITKYGRPLDRSNVWRDMKKLCASAGVQARKVFPHNLRHLFARTYYAFEKDLSRLADILGHANVNTTRIYTAESGTVHIRQLGRLGLVVAT